jgi:hypothetical protein
MKNYHDRIIAILEPSVGASLAESVLRKKCNDLGINPETIAPDIIPSLADGLYEPLRVFGGEVFARDLVARIRGLAP